MISMNGELDAEGQDKVTRWVVNATMTLNDS